MVSERWLTVKELCCDGRTSWQVLGQTLDKTITDKLDPEQALRMVPKVGKEIGTKFGFGTSWRVATTCRAELGRTIGCVSSWGVTVTRSLAMLWESDQTIGPGRITSGSDKASSETRIQMSSELDSGQVRCVGRWSTFGLVQRYRRQTHDDWISTSSGTKASDGCHNMTQRRQWICFGRTK